MKNGKESKDFALMLLMVLIGIYFTRLFDRINEITGQFFNRTGDPVISAIAILVGIIFLVSIYSIV